MPSLRDIRVEQAISIRELTKLSGVASSTIFAIESGNSLPRLLVARKLSKALGVAPGDVTEFATALDRARRPPVHRLGASDAAEAPDIPKEDAC